MENQIEINWNQAQVVSQEVQKQATTRKAEKLAEFLESKCDLFSMEDWNFYVKVTGKSLQWLRENASYSDEQAESGQMLTNAMIDGDHELIETFFI